MITLRPALADDLPYIMELEERFNAQGYVLRDSLETHRERLASPDARYFIGLRDRVPAGFVILRGFAGLHRSVEVKRLAAADPGQGIGREMLRLAVGAAFAHPDTHRVWLDVYPENERARRAYRALGFVEEGLLRECEFDGQRLRSLVIMSILAREYRG
jgi:RimJ/RimL family protein N-acetyltransferase